MRVTFEFDSPADLRRQLLAFQRGMDQIDPPASPSEAPAFVIYRSSTVVVFGPDE